MNTTKHTPGPWYSLDDGGGAVYMDQTLIARAADSPHMQANARLIAAAPETKRQRDELLAALQAIASAATSGTNPEPAYLRSIAAAAIAKAGGAA